MDKFRKNIKKERVKRLIELSNQLEKEYANLQIGLKLPVLIETNFDNTSFGHTENYLKVKIPEKISSNKIINVKILKSEDNILIGERV